MALAFLVSLVFAYVHTPSCLPPVGPPHQPNSARSQRARVTLMGSTEESPGGSYAGSDSQVGYKWAHSKWDTHGRSHVRTRSGTVGHTHDIQKSRVESHGGPPGTPVCSNHPHTSHRQGHPIPELLDIDVRDFVLETCSLLDPSPSVCEAIY